MESLESLASGDRAPSFFALRAVVHDSNSGDYLDHRAWPGQPDDT